MDLEIYLTDRAAFNGLAKETNVDLSFDQDYSPIKRWEIFSRVRFEYVRPIRCAPVSGQISILPSMSEDEKNYGIKAYLQSGLNPNIEAIEKLRQSLVFSKPGTLAEALKAYYQAEPIEIPGTNASLFPASYIIVHDLHHVLLGVDTSHRGELIVIAYESGMIQKTEFPILLIEQLEVFVSPLFKDIKSHELLKYWNIGVNSVELVDNWEWWHDLDLPLSVVREKYNILGV